MTRTLVDSRGKYNARKTVVDGITFASGAEARRYRELTLLARAGFIRSLECQPRYPLVVNGVKVCVYVADFRYLEANTGRTVVEDVKGVRTRVYSIKAKLMRAVHGIEIQEVRS